jgi:uncharacterized protein (TIGR00369 family)
MENDQPLFARMREIARMLSEGTPHAKALGFEITDVERGKGFARITPRAELVGDPETGVIAGGVITALLDNLGGVAVMAALDEPTSIATLDLRIDYMKAAAPGEVILAVAHCYKVTRSVAFMRASAHHGDEADPIATATGAYMLSSNAGRGVGANRKVPR